ERGDLVVVGKLLRDFRHFARVGRVEWWSGRLRIAAVARRERVNQRLLARARVACKRLRLLCGRISGRERVFLHRKIDIGPEHQGLAPEAHGAIRIELLRHAERTLRLAVIEGVGKTQALVEIGLRALVRGRNLVSDGTETGPQWGARGVGIWRRCWR